MDTIFQKYHQIFTSKPFSVLLLLLIGVAVQAQDDYVTKQIKFDGKIYTALVSPTDTLIMQELDDVSITSPRSFADYDEYRKYVRYRRYAQKVYPYAVEAIKIFREVEYATNNLSKRKRKKHIRKLSKQLKKEFNDPLKKLTKTQGYILVKMIERELDTPMYELVKGLKGGFTAGYYNQFGKLYGYDLKGGYVVGEDKLLDIVLQDFDISHKLSK